MAGITRYAAIHMPMDETLSRVVIDISGRPVLVFKVEFPRDKVGTVRHRTGARMVQRLCDQCRRDFARRDPIWREQPSYRRILLQGSGEGAARGGRDRSARRGRSAIHQGSARRLILGSSAERYDAGLHSSCSRATADAGIARPTGSYSFATAFISGRCCSALLWLAWHRLWLALIGWIVADRRVDFAHDAARRRRDGDRFAVDAADRAADGI